MTSKEKTRFRESLKWKRFRAFMIKEQNHTCQCCGCKPSRIELHHMDEAHYTDLQPEKFVCLCHSCHKQISRLQQIKPENRWKYNQVWVQFYQRFLIEH